MKEMKELTKEEIEAIAKALNYAGYDEDDVERLFVLDIISIHKGRDDKYYILLVDETYSIAVNVETKEIIDEQWRINRFFFKGEKFIFIEKAITKK